MSNVGSVIRVLELCAHFVGVKRRKGGSSEALRCGRELCATERCQRRGLHGTVVYSNRITF